MSENNVSWPYPSITLTEHAQWIFLHDGCIKDKSIRRMGQDLLKKKYSEAVLGRAAS